MEKLTPSYIRNRFVFHEKEMEKLRERVKQNDNLTFTKDEALIMLDLGYKMTMECFSSDEYVWKDGESLRFEDGVYVMEWWDEIEPGLRKTSDHPWRIWKENEKETV